MNPHWFALSLPPRLCLLIFNVHALLSDSLLRLAPFQSCHRHNGDRGLEVNDPVAPSLGRRSLPRAGLGPVSPLRSSQEASKTVVTGPLCSRESATEGLAGLPLWFPPKLHTLEFKRRRRMREEESGAVARQCGEPGTRTTDIRQLGKEKKWGKVGVACSPCRSRRSLCQGGKSSCLLLFFVLFFFPLISKMALIYLPLLRSRSGELCLFYSVPALSQRPGLLQVALVPMNSHFLICSKGTKQRFN